jgi:DNA-binding transcriptional LysR family regulator
MHVSQRQLRIFLAVVAEHSFSGAARALSLHQPAVSAAIRDLEAELGTALFDRTSRRVTPTAAGRLLAEGVGDAFGRLAASLAAVEDLAAQRAGSVTLGAPPLLAATLAPTLLARFAAHRPGIALRLREATTGALAAGLARGEIDLAIGTFPEEDGHRPSRSGPLRIETVGGDHLVLVAAPGHPLAARGAVAWADLAGAALVSLGPESGVRALIDREAASAGVALSHHMEVSQMASVVGLVAAGLGAGVLPSYAVRGASGVVHRPLEQPRVARPIHLARAGDRSLSPAAGAFAALIRNDLGSLIG